MQVVVTGDIGIEHILVFSVLGTKMVMPPNLLSNLKAVVMEMVVRTMMDRRIILAFFMGRDLVCVGMKL